MFIGPSSVWCELGLLGAMLAVPPTSPPSGEAASRPDASSSKGREVYAVHCLPCHGAEGRGDGPAAVHISPRPRDLTTGRFRLRSTMAGEPPTDEDLFRTVTRGIPGSSMTAFAFLPEADRRAVVTYMKSLSPAFAGSAAEPLPLVPRPPRTVQAIAAGKAVYDRLLCDGCHGEKGRGDGHMADVLDSDDSGSPVRPRDLVAGHFKGGTTAEDIYLRLTTGMEGSPMLAVTDSRASTVERWQLAYYVESLRTPAPRDGKRLARRGDTTRRHSTPRSAIADGTIADSRIVSKTIGTPVPDDPLSVKWQEAPAQAVATQPLWNRSAPTPTLVVRSLNHGGVVAFLLEWPDPTPNGAVLRIEDFRDGVALQLANGAVPFVGMGAPTGPVQIWHWKADWQAEADRLRRGGGAEGATPDRASQPSFVTAQMAGNPVAVADPRNTVEETVAGGPGTLDSKPPQDQQVRGTGIWAAGYWRVVLSRPLHLDGEPPDRAHTNVAFALWDGAQRERGGQKAISAWYELALPGSPVPADTVSGGRTGGHTKARTSP